MFLSSLCFFTLLTWFAGRPGLGKKEVLQTQKPGCELGGWDVRGDKRGVVIAIFSAVTQGAVSNAGSFLILGMGKKRAGPFYASASEEDDGWKGFCVLLAVLFSFLVTWGKKLFLVYMGGLNVQNTFLCLAFFFSVWIWITRKRQLST